MIIRASPPRMCLVLVSVCCVRVGGKCGSNESVGLVHAAKTSLVSSYNYNLNQFFICKKPTCHT